VELVPDKRLFWFLKDDVRFDLSVPSQLDMYLQQVLTHGISDDIKFLFKNITITQFEESFTRCKTFLPLEIRKFWEHALQSS